MRAAALMGIGNATAQREETMSLFKKLMMTAALSVAMFATAANAEPIKIGLPAPELRSRLDLAFVGELRRSRAQHLAHRDTCSSRTISLIDRPRTKYSRRIRAIVSTPFIPQPPITIQDGQSARHANSGGQFWTPIPRLRGSKLHADSQAYLLRHQTGGW